jgi:hypothetical protein
MSAVFGMGDARAGWRPNGKAGCEIPIQPVTSKRIPSSSTAAADVTLCDPLR